MTSHIPVSPKAVIAEGVMPLPASAPAVPAAPAPEPQAETAALPIESLLLRFRMITPAQLADAMKEEAVSGKSVSTIVVEKGWVTAEAMAQIAPDAAAAAPAPATEPEPAAAPAPVVEQAPVVEAPAPAPEPAPVAPEPAAPLMPEPVAEQPFLQPEASVAAAPPAPFVTEPEPEPETLIEALAPVVEPVAVAPVEPELGRAAVSAPPVFQVLAHLTNGERVEISRAGDMDEAKAAATAAMHALRDGGDWPLLSGRYVRPESIISIDVAVL